MSNMPFGKVEMDFQSCGGSVYSIVFFFNCLYSFVNIPIFINNYFDFSVSCILAAEGHTIYNIIVW